MDSKNIDASTTIDSYMTATAPFGSSRLVEKKKTPLKTRVRVLNVGGLFLYTSRDNSTSRAAWAEEIALT